MGFGGSGFPIIVTALVIVISVVRLIIRTPWTRVLLQGALAVYASFVIDLTLLPIDLDLGARTMYQADLEFWWRSVNLIPFATLSAQLSPGAPPTAVSQILGNLALLFPFGMLAPAAFRISAPPHSTAPPAESVSCTQHRTRSVEVL